MSRSPRWRAATEPEDETEDDSNVDAVSARIGDNSLTPEQSLSSRDQRRETASLARVKALAHASMNHSALLPLHVEAGARLQGDGSAARVLTFGDVPAEYRAARENACLFDESDRGRIDVRGAEAAAFLHRITANDVHAVQPGHGCRNLLLSAKGKVRFEFDLARDADAIRLSVPHGYATGLVAALDTYLFAEKVELADTSAGHAPIAICGPKAQAIVSAALGVSPPSTDHESIRATFGAGAVTITRLPVAGSPGFRLDAGTAAPALWTRLCATGAKPAGIVARDILRVEAGSALFGVDVDDSVYPQEARWEDAFSLTKGCYIGQEVVAKIDTYGGLNKRLVTLRVSSDDPIAHGARLLREQDGAWTDLGVVSSWAYSFVLDTGLVLGYVKRRHQSPGTTFRVGDSAVQATIVPMPVRPDAVPVSGEFE